MTKQKKILRLKGARELERLLSQKVRTRLAEKTAADPDYVARAKKLVGERPAGMKRHDFWRFRILHRQFDGLRAPGLAILIRTARFLVGNLRRQARTSA